MWSALLFVLVLVVVFLLPFGSFATATATVTTVVTATAFYSLLGVSRVSSSRNDSSVHKALSTPFWEFPRINNDKGFRTTATTATFYSLLGVSRASQP